MTRIRQPDLIQVVYLDGPSLRVCRKKVINPLNPTDRSPIGLENTCAPGTTVSSRNLAGCVSARRFLRARRLAS
jgi:hypothetical protein